MHDASGLQCNGARPSRVISKSVLLYERKAPVLTWSSTPAAVLKTERERIQENIFV